MRLIDVEKIPHFEKLFQNEEYIPRKNQYQLIFQKSKSTIKHKIFKLYQTNLNECSLL